MAERPKRKVISRIKMPAAASRGGYEVPEEIAEVREEEDPAYSHMEIDPVTGKEYSARGIEEAELLPATPFGLAEAGAAYAGKKAIKAGTGALGKAFGQKATTTITGKSVPKSMTVESIREADDALATAASKDVDEDLEVFMESLKETNPELGKQKSPSTLKKIRDMYQDWKTNKEASKYMREGDRRKKAVDESLRQEFEQELQEAERLRRMKEPVKTLLPTAPITRSKKGM